MSDRSNRHSAAGRIGNSDPGDGAGFDTNVVNAAALDVLIGAPPHDESVPIRQVVFIDGSVPDAELLAKGVAPGVVAVILAPDQDGVAQIANWLAAHKVSNLAAIDLVAHGADGTVALGSAILDSATLASHASALASIGAALQPGGAIQIYGCDVAQDASGDAFLAQLSAATGGASVAAASHEVGAASGGGSWTLDFNTGTVDVAVPFTQSAISAYPDELALTSNQLYVLFDAKTGSTLSPNTALIDFSLTGGTVVANGTYSAKSTIVSNNASLDGPQSVAIDAPQNEYYVVVDDFLDNTNEILRGSLSGGALSVVLNQPDVNNYSISNIALDQPDGYLYYTLSNFGTLSGDDPISPVPSGIYKIPISSLTGTIAFPGTAVATFPGTLTYESPYALALDLSQNLIFFSNTDFNNDVNDLDVATTSGHIQTLTSQLPQSVQNELSINQGNAEAVLVSLAVDPVHDELYIDASAGSGNGVAYIFKAAYSVNGGGTVTIGSVSTLYAAAASEYPQEIQIDTLNNLLYVSGNVEINTNSYQGYVYEGSLNGSGSAPLKLIDQQQDASGYSVSGAFLLSQPTIVSSGTISYNTGAASTRLDSLATVSNPDGTNLDGVTVSIAGGFSAGDTLAATALAGTGITGSYSPTSGVLTLTGNASAAQYQVAVDSVTFSSSSTTGGTRTIDWTATNGVITSATAVSSVFVHTAPTITAGSTVTFTGGGSPVVLDSGLAIADSSGTIQTSATVTIGNVLSSDTLTVGTLGGLASSFSNGVLTLTGTATTATYKAALDSVSFSESPSNSDPTADGTKSSHAITFSVNNGFVQSAGAISTVNLVHAAPTVTAAGTVTFTGGGGAVTLDSGVAISDPDSGGVLSSATVTIGSAITGDTLNFSNTNSTTEGNVAVSSNSGGVLVLTSSGNTATLAQWQTALEAVTYSFSPSNGDPTGGGAHTSRTISYTVNDGAASSAASTSTLHTVHLAPTVVAGGAITYVIGNSPGTLDPTLSLSDPDSGGLIQSATVSVSGGAGLGDVLATSTTGTPAITASYDAANEILTLTGSDTLADYQAALRLVTISGTTAGTRTIDYTINDGAASSAVVTSRATLQAVPAIAAGGTVTYNDGGTTPVLLDSGLTVTDASATQLTGATVTIGNYLNGDTLSVGTPGGLTSGFSNGTLTLTGTASIATYDAALDSVGYLFTPSTADPTNGGTDSTRPIAYTVTDSNGNASVPASSTLNTHVPPTVTAGGSATFTENGAPVPLDGGLTIADPDSATLIGATVAISSGFLSGDTLTWTPQSGIGGVFNGTTGVLTFTGTAPIAAYQSILDSVTYSFTGDPSAGGTDYNRTITWSVTDGAGTSTPATSSLTVTCFRSGTLIATPAGDVPVEHLVVGDKVRTASGAIRPIVWIGIGRVLCTRGRRSAATPVIVEKSALGPNLPHKDLCITKAHALHIDGVLIPVEFLVNHRSIRWDDRAQEVTLYHIELETHDVLLANGAPAESYRDDGNRWLFRNANSGWGLPPQAPCAPVVTGGPKVDAAWRRLLLRSWGNRKLPPLTDDADLHLVVDGQRIDPVTKSGGAHVFQLAAVPAQVRIVSRDGVPSELAIARDERSLGVALRRIAVRQGARFIVLDARDERLVAGFHRYEPATGLRWTDGDAALPACAFAGFDGTLEVVLQVAAVTQYPLLDDKACRVAA